MPAFIQVSDDDVSAKVMRNVVKVEVMEGMIVYIGKTNNTVKIAAVRKQGLQVLLQYQALQKRLQRLAEKLKQKNAAGKQ